MQSQILYARNAIEKCRKSVLESCLEEPNVCVFQLRCGIYGDRHKVSMIFEVSKLGNVDFYHGCTTLDYC